MESGDQYQVYWFVWSRDGIFCWEDWEPVLLIYYSEGKLGACLVRRAFRWEFYDAEEDLVVHDETIEVIFADRQHHPVLLTWNGEKYFRKLRERHVPIEARPELISPSEVPGWVRDSKLLADRAVLDGIPSCRENRSLSSRLLGEALSHYPRLVATPSIDEKIREMRELFT